MRRLLLIGFVILAQSAFALSAHADQKGCTEGNVEACTDLIEKSQGASEDKARLLHWRALAYEKRGELDRAITDYDTSLRIRPNSDTTLHNRGDTYSKKKDYDRAIADFNASLKLKPNDPATLGSRAVAYGAKRDHERAIADFNASLRVRPNHATTLVNRGSEYYRVSNNELAIADYTAALRVQPGDATTTRFRGNAYFAKGDYALAIADFDVALRATPDDAATLSRRGTSKSNLGRYDQAIADYDASLKLRPGNDVTIHNRGNAYFGKGDYDRAIADFNESLRVNPNDPVTLNSRGEAFAKKKDYANAIADFDAALSARPDYARAKSNREDAAARKAEVDSQFAATAGPKRVALVIANAAYAHADPLRNPANDGRRIADALRAVGFSNVMVRGDLTRDGMLKALKEFGALAADADWAVVYFAGHGIEVGGVNYLVPVDARLDRMADVSDEAVEHRRVLERIEGAAKLRLLILDACRNNPFTRRLAMDTSAGARVRTVGTRGLGRVEPSFGELVAYSARDGTTSLDGEGGNSPYADALARHLAEPGLDIRFLFDKVRDSVMRATKNEQMPFTYGSLPAEEFVFKRR